jgi:hypothetical protein
MPSFRHAVAVVSLLLGALGTGAVACSEEKNARPPPAPTPPDTTQDGGTTPPSDAGGTRLDPLGPQFEELGQLGPELDIDVPEGTLGFSFSAGAAEVLAVRDPTGKEYLAASAPAGLTADFAKLTRFPAMSQRLDVPAGKWHVTLSEAAQIKVARQRTSDGKFHGGVLDLYVYLPTGVHAEDFVGGVKPGEVVSSANAAANPVMTTFVSTLFAQIKRLWDLDRGAVKFIDVNATYLTVADPTAARLAANVGGRTAATDLGLHVLLTENLFGRTANGFAAARGGIDFDRPANAVIVDVKDMEPAGSTAGAYTTRGFAATDLPVLATLHQAGQLLGLPVTSDRTITPWDDGFSDTPSCSLDTLDASDNLCPDNVNLMFPLQNQPVVRITISEHQRAVIRGTTFYKPYAP